LQAVKAILPYLLPIYFILCSISSVSEWRWIYIFFIGDYDTRSSERIASIANQNIFTYFVRFLW